MKKLNKKGFTLVELLAVIVILALLMVVATRTVGSSLTSSKNKAMQAEINKIVTKTYEEANAAILLKNSLAATDFSYDIGGGTYDATNNILSGTEGDYEYTVTLDVSASPITVTRYCITDTKNGYNQSVPGASINGGNSIAFTDTASYVSTIKNCY